MIRKLNEADKRYLTRGESNQVHQRVSDFLREWEDLKKLAETVDEETGYDIIEAYQNSPRGSFDGKESPEAIMTNFREAINHMFEASQSIETAVDLIKHWKNQ